LRYDNDFIVAAPQQELAMATACRLLAALLTYPGVPPASLVMRLWPVRAVDVQQDHVLCTRSGPAMLLSHFVTVLCAVSGAHGPDTAVRVTDTIVVLGHVPYRPQDGLQRPRSLDFSDRERARNGTDRGSGGGRRRVLGGVATFTILLPFSEVSHFYHFTTNLPSLLPFCRSIWLSANHGVSTLARRAKPSPLPRSAKPTSQICSQLIYGGGS
jgi:hypothetical protein